jgi:hypothetical protein
MGPMISGPGTFDLLHETPRHEWATCLAATATVAIIFNLWEE